MDNDCDYANEENALSGSPKKASTKSLRVTWKLARNKNSQTSEMALWAKVLAQADDLTSVIGTGKLSFALHCVTSYPPPDKYKYKM